LLHTALDKVARTAGRLLVNTLGEPVTKLPEGLRNIAPSLAPMAGNEGAMPVRNAASTQASKPPENNTATANTNKAAPMIAPSMAALWPMGSPTRAAAHCMLADWGGADLFGGWFGEFGLHHVK
jgi:hypothetical protein